MSNTLPGRIKSAREAAGLSLRQAASAMDIAPSTLLRWEDGTHCPRVCDVPTICRVTRCDAHWLVFGRPKGRLA